MKLLVVSDTHKHTKDFIREAKRINDIDLLIHLGDYVEDAITISDCLGVDMINVKGNCDVLERDAREEELIQVKGKKILLTHGHLYGVKMDIDRIYYRALELEADIALFGHSHIQTLVNHEGILFFNPGSPSLSRGGSKKGYGIIEIEHEIYPKLINVE